MTISETRPQPLFPLQKYRGRVTSACKCYFREEETLPAENEGKKKKKEILKKTEGYRVKRADMRNQSCGSVGEKVGFCAPRLNGCNSETPSLPE